MIPISFEPPIRLYAPYFVPWGSQSDVKGSKKQRNKGVIAKDKAQRTAFVDISYKSTRVSRLLLIFTFLVLRQCRRYALDPPQSLLLRQHHVFSAPIPPTYPLPTPAHAASRRAQALNRLAWL